jgi:type IV secretory pathway TrbL component
VHKGSPCLQCINAAFAGESQYEYPDDIQLEETATIVAAKVIQDAWRLHASRYGSTIGQGLSSVGSNDDEVMSKGATSGSSSGSAAAWEEVDLTFEAEGSLGIVFSSETEHAMKVVTEVIPGKLASQVPELAASFDERGKPIEGQPALALIEVQAESVEHISFSEAVRHSPTLRIYRFRGALNHSSAVGSCDICIYR